MQNQTISNETFELIKSIFDTNQVLSLNTKDEFMEFYNKATYGTYYESKFKYKPFSVAYRTLYDGIPQEKLSNLIKCYKLVSHNAGMANDNFFIVENTETNTLDFVSGAQGVTYFAF